MKGAVAIIVIVILLFAGFIVMIQTQREEAEKKYTFADILGDYIVTNLTTNEARFKTFRIGDTIKITDTIIDVFVVESNQTGVNASTGIYLKSVGKGNHSLFGVPVGLGFEGDKSSEYVVGKKVTIEVKVTGKDALHESLAELALFFELYEAHH